MDSDSCRGTTRIESSWDSRPYQPLTVDTFVPSDSDLVFRRKERWILAGVLAFDTLLFAGLFIFLMSRNTPDMILLGGIFVLAILGLALLTAWMWTYEVRLTSYELVIRSLFGTRVYSYSNINGLRRERVPGKYPPVFQMRLILNDDRRLVVPSVHHPEAVIFEELQRRCPRAEIEDGKP